MSGHGVCRSSVREGFTLIELLVVMVVIAMLMGILMPVLGRAEEEARKTKCRSNLRQIGQALIVFSNDNRGYTPQTHGWLDYPPKRLGDCSDERYAPFVVNGWYGPNYPDGSLRDRPLSSGLGLIYKGGYLTSAGAPLLYCPSDTSIPTKIPGALRSKYQYDANEPFWTSKTPEFSDYDGVGDLGDTSGATVTDGDEELRGRYVFTNYWIRTKSKLTSWPLFVDESSDYNSLRIREAGLGGRKFVRDGEIHGRSPETGSPPGSDMPVYVTDSLGGSFPSAVQYFDGDLTTPPGDVFLQNHDAAYNVLFVDGTVKTFADGGRSIKKTLETLAKDLVNGSPNQPGSAVVEPIFMVYFDTLYIAD